MKIKAHIRLKELFLGGNRGEKTTWCRRSLKPVLTNISIRYYGWMSIN
jgi:hypothetical protein